MTKISVLLVWLIVTGVACALDSGCDDSTRNCSVTTKTGTNEISINNSTGQIITHTLKPIETPKVLSMIADDEHYSEFRPTVKPVSQEEAKARSINFTQMDEHTHSNELTKNASKKDYKNKVIDLSDVSMDDEDEDFNDEPLNAAILMNTYPTSKSNGSCERAGMIYANGQKLLEDCDSVCICTDGKMDCADRCIKPFVKRGRKIEDPLCTEQPVHDICCATLTCSDTATEALEICSYNNKTFNRGETIRNDCESTCYCGPGGKVICKARCPPTKKVNEKCVEIPHPEDKCCKTVVCDVSEDEHEPREEHYKIVSAKYTNDTTIKIEFASQFHVDFVKPLIDLSYDKKNWTTYTLLPNDYLYGIDKTFKYIRIENGEDILEIQNISKAKEIITGNHCIYKGNKYEFNQEFNDSCEALCVCKESGVKCFKIECPTFFGTDILDPTCVQWETVPANFTPVPPKCCPEKLKCKSHGECEYEDKMYSNWQELPANVTGCKKRCYCEMGKIECQEVCPPVVATPPNTLPCLPHFAILAHPPGEDCCVDWICEEPSEVSGGFPPGYFSTFNSPQQEQDGVVINTLEPIDPYTVKLIFDIPHIIVGLYGRVEVRYTTKENIDPDSWSLQVFAPPHDLLATPQLEFQLTELKPDTEYRIQVTVTLRDMHNTHTSKIYKVHTPKETLSSTLPPMIPIEPDMLVAEVNSTWARMQWRSFTQNEMEFIDGIQLRYKELDAKLYQATPLIHREVTSYILENLKYKTTYEVRIFFIPYHNQRTELHSNRVVKFTTKDLVNIYAFNVSLDITQVKATSVEISWKGVPYPEDKYVNVYRAVYQSDSGKGDYSTFKVAKRDSDSKTIIMDLKPGTRYRLWLEVYLTNGKVKTSKVQDFITKPGSAPVLGASMHDKLSGDISEQREDYYGPLVIVAILATLAILSTLVLLLILIRRHGQNKASITQPPRVSQSAYDNPTYKVEIQQETMNL